MSLFDKLLKDTVGKAVKDAAREGARQAVQPVVNQAANAAANAAAQGINNATAELRQSANEAAASLNEANEAASKVSNEDWQKAMGFLEGMATSASKNMKTCPNCGEMAKADVKFCPACGAKLPEKTVFEMATCPNCGHQNDIGTAFCAECGTKLPSKIAEEEAAKARDEAELAKWDDILPQYPKWCFAGSDIQLEDRRGDGDMLAILSVGNTNRGELNKYFALLKENGFRAPDGWSSDETVFKVIDGNAYCVNQTDAFQDPDCFSIYFGIDNRRLPRKEEPKKKGLFGNLFG
ncbi:MAG: zinc ribbon domain-containing protein [Clostridia bacterium]|nr:zinc ribbon domain-containing protein [Clostridia bacterium]